MLFASSSSGTSPSGASPRLQVGGQRRPTPPAKRAGGGKQRQRARGERDPHTHAAREQRATRTTPAAEPDPASAVGTLRLVVAAEVPRSPPWETSGVATYWERRHPASGRGRPCGREAAGTTSVTGLAPSRNLLEVTRTSTARTRPNMGDAPRPPTRSLAGGGECSQHLPPAGARKRWVSCVRDADLREDLGGRSPPAAVRRLGRPAC